MADTKKHTLGFAYGESVQEPGTIVMRFKHTGIDLTIDQHRAIMDAVCPEISAALFALAHDMEAEDVTFESEAIFETSEAVPCDAYEESLIDREMPKKIA